MPKNISEGALKVEGTSTHINCAYASHGMQGDIGSVGWTRVSSCSIAIIGGSEVVNGGEGSVFENLGLFNRSRS